MNYNLDFLKEAFQKLDEATFDVGQEDIDNLDAFLQDSQDDSEEELLVIDDDASSEEDLKASYVGNVICECPVCHSYLFRAKAGINYDAETNTLVDEEECPYCCEPGNFIVIGEVAKFSPETAEEESEEKDVEEAEADDVEETESTEVEAEEEKEETVEEDKVEESVETPTEEPISESVETCEETPKNLDPDKFTPDEDNRQQEISEESCKKDEEISNLLNSCLGESKWDSADFDEETECLEVFKADECIGKYQIVEGKLYDIDANCVIDGTCETEPIVESTSLDEGTVKAEVEDGDAEIEVTTDSEAEAEVVVKFEPEEKEEEVAEEEPVAEVEAEAEVTVEEPAAEEGAEGEVETETEVKVEEEPVEAEEKEEEEETDETVSEFEFESFNKVCTNYLQNIYENVQDFAVSNAVVDGNTVTIDGTINFKSGNTKPTQFVFEAKDITKSNKARFVGMNESFSRGKKTFTIAGTLTDGKYVTESMTYNYHVKAPSGRTVRVCGTAN